MFQIADKCLTLHHFFYLFAPTLYTLGESIVSDVHRYSSEDSTKGERTWLINFFYKYLSIVILWYIFNWLPTYHNWINHRWLVEDAWFPCRNLHFFCFESDQRSKFPLLLPLLTQMSLLTIHLAIGHTLLSKLVQQQSFIGLTPWIRYLIQLPTTLTYPCLFN